MVQVEMKVHECLALAGGGTSGDTVSIAHISYRDSELTRVLQEALSGRAGVLTLSWLPSHCFLVIIVHPAPTFAASALLPC